MMSSVRVRFAPSPTGHLHVGSVRAALFNYLFARHHGGHYLLRIEDTDVVRSKVEYVEAIMSSLRWLDLMPDEDPLFQLNRREEHLKIAHDLVRSGHAYACRCEPRERDDESGYSAKQVDPCRDQEYALEDDHQVYAIRFKLSDDTSDISFTDMIRGNVTVSLDQLDDFVLVRRGGVPTYNFVVVLDDLYMNITHVIRGEDHVSNTPKQLLLYRALKKDPPQFAHIPLILGPRGNRLSKRDAAVSVDEYRDAGYLADAFINYLARLGWSHGDQEIFTRDELIKHFDIAQVQKKGAIFDQKKLDWLNGIYLRERDLAAFLDALDDIDTILRDRLVQTWDEKKLSALFEEYKKRATTLRDLYTKLMELSQTPDSYDISLIKKWWSTDAKEAFVVYREKLDESDFLHDALLSHAQMICEKHGIKLVALAQALRLALTGGIQSPGIFDLMAILGRDTVRARVDFFIATISS